jgi:hypothetical protein
MPPNAAVKMSTREHTRPNLVPPPSTHPSDGSVSKKKSTPPPGRRELTKPFGTEIPEPRKSDVRELASRVSYRPPAPCAPRSTPPRGKATASAKARAKVESIAPRAPKAPASSSAPPSTPKARVSLADFKAPTPEKKAPVLRAVASTPPPIPSEPSYEAAMKEDETPSGIQKIVRMPAPPPVPHEAIAAMPTAELPVEEIDYDAAYGYDVKALEQRLQKRSSIVPPALVDVATDVRASLAPAGRAEAAKELRDMRRVTFRAFAELLRRGADFFERVA